MAFAGLGAAEVLRAHPDDVAAAAPAGRRRRRGRRARTPIRGWPWPQQRLTYANAALAEVVIAAGHLRGDGPLLAAGLRMLTWLRDIQLRDGRLSVVPAGGLAARRGRGCATTSSRSRSPPSPTPAPPRPRSPATRRGTSACGRRSGGSSATTTSASPMWDPATGGGYDGLTLHLRFGPLAMARRRDPRPAGADGP